MDKFQIKAVIAGLLFGIYPLLLNRSKVSGNIMGATFSFLVALFIIPFALKEVRTLGGADWRMLVGAGVLSAVAVMAMASFLSVGNPATVGLLIILMIVTQAIVTAVYQTYMDGKLSFTRFLGFGCAVAAIYLLNKK